MTLPPPAWLIEPIIPVGGLVGLYGVPGSGKSFLAIDFAMAVASSEYWQGHPTEPGHVVYVSAEGGRGIGKRAHAWCTHHEVPPRDTNIAWLLDVVPIYPDSTQMDALLARIYEVDRRPALIVIDTLARCFDGDENQQEDMGRFIAGVDLLRHEFETTVLIVHHTRLAGDRERGNTAFRGAADTMLALGEAGARMTLDCSKQKDYESFERRILRMDKVAGTESCVPTLVSSAPGRPLEHDIGAFLAPLREFGQLTSAEWRSHIPQMPRATFFRYLKRQCETGEIASESGEYRLLGGSASQIGVTP